MKQVVDMNLTEAGFYWAMGKCQSPRIAKTTEVTGKGQINPVCRFQDGLFDIAKYAKVSA